MLRLAASLLVLVPSVASATRLALCSSGKTGHIQLDITSDGHGAYTLSSKDDVAGGEARIFRGTVSSASHRKIDKRHHAYLFVISDGSLQQSSGLDEKNCKTDGVIATCPLDTIEIRLAKGGPTEPGDDGMSARHGAAEIQMDNGGPQDCTVFASKALTKLLKSVPRS